VKARLPVRCVIRPGESLPGFVSRAVAINHYESMATIADWLGLHDYFPPFSHSHVRALAEGRLNVEQFSEFTEQAPCQIERAVLRMQKPALAGRYNSYVSSRFWRFCPQCLADEEPHQRSWLLPFITACEKHLCRLIDHCTFCSAPYDMRVPLTLRCQSCHKLPVQESAHIYEQQCTIALTESLDDLTELHWLLDRLMTAWLFTSPTKSLKRRHQWSPQLKTVNYMSNVVRLVWPAARNDLTLASAIALQSYEIEDKWPFMPHAKRLVIEAAASAGAYLPDTTKCIDRDARFTITDLAGWRVSVAIASKASGISPAAIRGLIKRGLLSSATRFSSAKERRRGDTMPLSMNELNDLVGSLHARAEIVPSEEGLSKLIRRRFCESVDLIVSGQMPVYKLAKATNVGGLLVRTIDVTAGSKQTGQPPDTLTSQQVAKLLGTYHQMVADLIHAGHLRKHAASTARRLYIDCESCAAFKARYITVGALAARLDVSAHNLGDRLMHLGIRPALVDTLTNVYLNADVESLDAGMLPLVKCYRTATGRRSTVRDTDLRDLRVRKLFALVKEQGGASSFCSRHRYSEGVLSLILRERKPFGERAARNMEKRAGLRYGYFG
jgi:hypothetical protein